MAEEVTGTLASLNPLGSFNIGIGTIASALLVFLIAIAVICVIALLIFLRMRKRQYKIIIPLFSRVGP